VVKFPDVYSDFFRFVRPTSCQQRCKNDPSHNGSKWLKIRVSFNKRWPTFQGLLSLSSHLPPAQKPLNLDSFKHGLGRLAAKSRFNVGVIKSKLTSRKASKVRFSSETANQEFIFRIGDSTESTLFKMASWVSANCCRFFAI